MYMHYRYVFNNGILHLVFDNEDQADYYYKSHNLCRTHFIACFGGFCNAIVRRDHPL